MAFIKEIISNFDRGSLLTKLIYINVGVFVAAKLATLVLMLIGVPSSVVASAIELPSECDAVIYRPWTLLTYMFMHGDLMHILANMLCLYWFGMVFMEFNTPKQLVALYVLSGIGGAAAYLSAYAFLPGLANVQGSLVGASAAVLGIMVATALQAPGYRMNLLFVGSVALKWIVVGTLVLITVSYDGSNLGGHIAHLGGVAIGAMYVLLLRHGCDMTKLINGVIDVAVSAFKKDTSANNRKYHYSANVQDDKPHRSATRKQFVSEKEERIDEILEKIRNSGYASLSKEEKEIIFSVRKK